MANRADRRKATFQSKKQSPPSPFFELFKKILMDLYRVRMRIEAQNSGGESCYSIAYRVGRDFTIRALERYENNTKHQGYIDFVSQLSSFETSFSNLTRIEDECCKVLIADGLPIEDSIVASRKLSEA